MQIEFLKNINMSNHAYRLIKNNLVYKDFINNTFKKLLGKYLLTSQRNLEPF